MLRVKEDSDLYANSFCGCCMELLLRPQKSPIGTHQKGMRHLTEHPVLSVLVPCFRDNQLRS